MCPMSVFPFFLRPHMSVLPSIGNRRAAVSVTDSPSRDADCSLNISVVMPCLNEAETLAGCIVEALQALADWGLSGEVVIADNGSSDGSQAIAMQRLILAGLLQ